MERNSKQKDQFQKKFEKNITTKQKRFFKKVSIEEMNIKVYQQIGLNHIGKDLRVKNKLFALSQLALL